MLNQVSLVGRTLKSERVEDNMVIMLQINRFEDDEIEYIPVVVNKATQNRIGYLRRSDLIGITGRLHYEKDSIKVIADRISYVG